MDNDIKSKKESQPVDNSEDLGTIITEFFYKAMKVKNVESELRVTMKNIDNLHDKYVKKGKP